MAAKKKKTTRTQEPSKSRKKARVVCADPEEHRKACAKTEAIHKKFPKTFDELTSEEKDDVLKTLAIRAGLVEV